MKTIIAQRGRPLSPKRTEYGKAIRKDYESHKVYEHRANMQRFEPRHDGICNTLTTVLKDNLILRKVERMERQSVTFDPSAIEEKDGVKYIKPSISKQIKEEDADNSAQFEKATEELEDSPELEEYLEEKTIEDYLYTAKDGNQYGIFKLSPRECGRLMGVNDADISKMLAVNSNSQCYKQFGNSIVVPVLMAIFSQLHIKGVTPWNELSEKERVELIKSTTRDWDNG